MRFVYTTAQSTDRMHCIILQYHLWVQFGGKSPDSEFSITNSFHFLSLKHYNNLFR